MARSIKNPDEIAGLVVRVIAELSGFTTKQINWEMLLSDLGLVESERFQLYKRLLDAARVVGGRALRGGLGGKIALTALTRATTVGDVVEVVSKAALPGAPGVKSAPVSIALPSIDTFRDELKIGRRSPRKRSPAQSQIRSPSSSTLEATDAVAAKASVAPDDKSAELPDNERRINVWIGDESAPLTRALKIGQSYPLHFRVGQPLAGSLVSGPEAVVPAHDVPASGLPTDWTVVSRDVELAAGTTGTTVTETMIDGARTWTARFFLLIPAEGDSAVPQIDIKPLTSDPRLDVIVTVRGDTYRRFRVALSASDAATTTISEPARIVDVRQPTPTAHMGLGTTHEWTTPAGVLSISVLSPWAVVKGAVDSGQVDSTEPWIGVAARMSGPMGKVTEAAEELRSAWETHLNDIPSDDLAKRLKGWGTNTGGVRSGPEYDWGQLGRYADAAHAQQWEAMARSPELRKLAYYGQQLFRACFDNNSSLARWVAAVRPGARLDISWLPTGSGDFIPHVPWGFMYVADLPPVGQPIDPMGFLGLRCRIAYTSHHVRLASRSLGALDETHRTHFLYWGDAPADAAGEEARWQRTQWAGWKNQVFVPQSTQNAKDELLKLLDDPQPAPTSLLYLYCHCSVGKGNNPVLRFGSTNDPEDTIRETEFATSALSDRPFVFLNACATAASDPYMANQLPELFFQRGCRGYLGTEIKVPIVFGSRFATIFFHFFYRLLDPEPMAAGEALAQTRLFLWTNYRNIGGLFYSQVNMYDLFVARADEVIALRR